jgi:hypothetical protein
MPVRKFRSIEEMKAARGYDRNDPLLPRVIEGIWTFGERTARLRFPPGVFRHRTLDELNACTSVWADENFRSFLARRAAERTAAAAGSPPTPDRG